MINNNPITYSVINSSNDHRLENILAFTQPVNIFYPDHTLWLLSTLYKGLDHGFRSVIVATNKNSKMVGCVILKDTHKEKKDMFVVCITRVQTTGYWNGID